MQSVMLAFPVYDKPHWQHEASAMETVGLLVQLGIKHGFCHSAGLPVHVARNLLVGAFLKTDFDNIMFIDADMAWKASDVVHLLQSPHPLIGGIGRKRCDISSTDHKAWCFRPLDEGGEHDEHGAFECQHVGTGFLKIAREVFETIGPSSEYFHWRYKDTTEDYAFCRDYRAVGGRVMADPTIELSHFGTSEHKARLTDYIT